MNARNRLTTFSSVWRLRRRFAIRVPRGVARIFQRGGRGHTVSNIIVMAFSPRNVVGCLLKKRLTKGGRSRAPQDPPRYALGSTVKPECEEQHRVMEK